MGLCLADRALPTQYGFWRLRAVGTVGPVLQALKKECQTILEFRRLYPNPPAT